MQKSYGNLAYDVNEIEYNRFVKKPKPEIKIVEKQKVRLRLGLVKICNFMMACVIAFCAVVVITSYAQATTLTKQQATLVGDLDKLQSQQILLNAQMDNMFNLEFVESFAESELSMVKIDQNQIEQVYIQNNDKVEVNSTSNSVNGLSSVFSKIFSNLVAYIA